MNPALLTAGISALSPLINHAADFLSEQSPIGDFISHLQAQVSGTGNYDSEITAGSDSVAEFQQAKIDFQQQLKQFQQAFLLELEKNQLSLSSVAQVSLNFLEQLEVKGEGGEQLSVALNEAPDLQKQLKQLQQKWERLQKFAEAAFVPPEFRTQRTSEAGSLQLLISADEIKAEISA